MDRESLFAGHCPSLESIVSLLESVPALLWETDSELRVTFLTGASLDAIGVSKDLCIGEAIASVFSAAAGARRIPDAHEGALAGHASSFEMELKGRDFQASVKPLRGANGAISGVVGIALDMTERMVAERAFRLSEHSYRSLIEDAPYAICRSTIGGVLLQVNRAMTDMLGYERAAGAELLLRDLPYVFNPPGAFEGFQKAVLDGVSQPGAESDWVRRDGQVIRVWVSGRVVRDRWGEISHLEIFAEDITERRRLEAELGQAQKMQALGQLAGGVAHDFNNLLTVISGYMEMLLSGALGAAESREPMVAVRDAAVKAAALTEQLLAFSRKRTPRIETIDVNEVLRKQVGILSRVIRENVELVLIAGDTLGFVRADPNEIERVVLNLVVNAQDAMPGGGRLTIETASPCGDDAEYVQILVRDTGTGMDRTTQARVFEPFFTTKEQNRGTGLGLFVVYGIVRQSGGHVRVESEPGAGTTFRIYLPRVASQPAGAAALDSLPQPPPRGSETILLVEDDPAIVGLLAPFLESLGYRVVRAPDGEAALEAARCHAGDIHLLLSDVVMPRLGGRELVSRLRRMDRPNLKVLFMSGYIGDTAEAENHRLDGFCLIQKPLSMDLLARTVRVTLDEETASQRRSATTV